MYTCVHYVPETEEKHFQKPDFRGINGSLSNRGKQQFNCL